MLRRAAWKKPAGGTDDTITIITTGIRDTAGTTGIIIGGIAGTITAVITTTIGTIGTTTTGGTGGNP